VRFLRRSTPDTPADETGDSVEVLGKGHTAGKGRATPKRRDAEGKRRGPVAPPPTNMREAMKRNKELRKANPVSKEERRDEGFLEAGLASLTIDMPGVADAPLAVAVGAGRQRPEGPVHGGRPENPRHRSTDGGL